MNHRSLVAIFMAIVLFSGCAEKTPQADHVVYMCFDAMSAIGIQRADTPTLTT